MSPMTNSGILTTRVANEKIRKMKHMIADKGLMRQGLCLSSRSFNEKESSSLSNCILIGSRTKSQMMMCESFETRG